MSGALNESPSRYGRFASSASRVARRVSTTFTTAGRRSTAHASFAENWSIENSSTSAGSTVLAAANAHCAASARPWRSCGISFPAFSAR
jgi:hypothetical protein